MSIIDKSIDRRSLIAGAGIAAAGAALASTAVANAAESSDAADSSDQSDSSDKDVPSWLGEAPSISDSDCVETVDTEVLVIGAGTSGYFAATSAAENGAKTLLIEKNSQGNGIRSSALGAVDSRQQIAQGVRIEKTEIVNDIDRLCLGQEDAGLWNIWAENSGEAIDWYEDLLNKNGMEIQLEYNMPEGTRYTEWPTGHGTNGDSYETRESDVSNIMNNYIASFDGCEVRFETALVELIVEDGTCTGVYATNTDGDYIRINASKGVIVATGGYAMNQEMYKDRQYQTYTGLSCLDAFPSCQGDGIKSLLWAGCSMDAVPTSLVFNRGLLRADQEIGDPYSHFGDYGYFFFSSQPFLRVNYKGERFHNESAPYDFVMHAVGKLPEGKRYWHQVWDANWKDDVIRFQTVGCSTLYHREGADHDSYDGQLDDVETEMEQFVDDGFIVKADTLEELAEKLGFEGDARETFLATCERQNELFDAGHDYDFGKEKFRISELRTAPFYASVKNGGLTLCTFDGIVCNHEFHPYGADGEPIANLCVVGNDLGGKYAGGYPNLAAGLNAGSCATFGRLAGKELAGA